MSYETPENIKQILRTLPTKPGCYLMKDISGRIIYVGKAKVLKNRVPNYFTKNADHTPKTLKMRSLVAEIEPTWPISLLVVVGLEAFVSSATRAGTAGSRSGVEDAPR